MKLFETKITIEPERKMWAVVLGRQNLLEHKVDEVKASELRFVIDGVAGHPDAFRIMSHYGDVTDPGSEVLTVNVNQVFKLSAVLYHPRKGIYRQGLMIFRRKAEDDLPEYVTHVISKVE